MFFILGGGQNPLVPALDAGTQKSKPYQSDVYMTGFNAIPRQAREQYSFDTPSTVMKAVLFLPPPLQVRAILISPSRSPYHLQDFSSEWNGPLSCSPHPAKRHLSIRMSHIRPAFVCRYFFRLQTTRLPADWRKS